MIRPFALLLLVALLAGCGTSRSFYQQGNATVESGPVRVPIHLVKELPLVDVRIGGRTYRFLLDTGAPTMISSELYKDLGLKPTARDKVRDTYGRVQKQIFTVLPRMEVGGLVLEHIGCVVHDIEVKELRCFGYDGILGANAMAQAYWLLDYAEGVAHVATDLGQLGTARFPVNVGFTTSKQRSPYIRGQVAGEEVRFLFDTGHNGRVQVPEGPDHYRALIPAEDRLEREGITSIGLYGQGHTRESLLFRADLQLDSLPFGERVCTTGNKGLLGNELWLDRPFLLDWNAQVIRFGAQQTVADSLDDFGFGYLFDGDTAVVVAIAKIPDMPLLIGDRILRIDGKPLTGLSEEEQCADFIHRFGPDQREISLVIERDSVQHALTLQKQRLL